MQEKIAPAPRQKSLTLRLGLLLLAALATWALLSIVNSHDLVENGPNSASITSQRTHDQFLQAMSASAPLDPRQTAQHHSHPSDHGRSHTHLGHAGMQQAVRSLNSHYGHETFVACTTIGGIGLVHCVTPEIQVEGKWKIFLIKQDQPKKGFRFHHLVHQGLELHPAVSLVEDLSEADVALYIPTCTKLLPVYNTTLPNGDVVNTLTPKLVVLDEGDGPGHVRHVKDGEYIAYFKRSWVRKVDGVFAHNPARYSHNYFPMAYSVSNNYTNGAILTTKRYHVVCTLRLNEKQPARRRVLGWTTDVVSAMGLNHSSVLGQVNSAQRRTISSHYLDINRQARIIVTCNPSSWEGDFRLWEALASGALVFVDHMYTPVYQPLTDGQHVVLYDPTDEMGFKSKLRYYVDHPHEAQEIALRGYFHVLRYHRSVSRIDYILRSIHEFLPKTVLEESQGRIYDKPSDAYAGTAMNLLQSAPAPRRRRHRPTMSP